MANEVLTSNELEMNNKIEQREHAKREASEARKKAIIEVNAVCHKVLNMRS